MTRDGFVLAVPLPPPYAGPEVASEALVAAARMRWAGRVDVLDVTVSRENAEKGFISARKVAKVGVLAPRLAALARRRTLVYVHLAQNVAGLSRDLAFMTAARTAGARLVVHLHGGMLADVDTPPWLLSPLRRVLKGQVGIALSESLVRHVAFAMPEAASIRVVPNGVAIPDAVTPPPFSADPGGALRVVYVSTLVRQKGYRRVVEGAALLNAEGPRVLVDLVGPAHLDEDARFVQEACAAHDWLTYHGAVEHERVAAFIKTGDVMALVPTWSEGAPLSVLEAMAAGRGVIVSRSGALPEMVGGAGWVVDPTPEGVAAALREALADPAGLSARAAALRERASREYSLDRSVARVLDVLEDVALAGAGRARR